MRREYRFEAVAVEVAGCAIGVIVMGGIPAIVVPIVSKGVAGLAHAGWRGAGGVDKATFGVKKLNRPGSTGRGGDGIANILAIQQAKAVGACAIWRLGTVRSTDVAQADKAFDYDLGR